MEQIYLASYFRSGYCRLMNYINNISSLSNKDQKIIFERIKIIEFFDRFGDQATKEAFTKSRSTVFLWKQILNQNGGRLSALKPQSKSPKNKRKREVDPQIKVCCLR